MAITAPALLDFGNEVDCSWRAQKVVCFDASGVPGHNVGAYPLVRQPSAPSRAISSREHRKSKHSARKF